MTGNFCKKYYKIVHMSIKVYSMKYMENQAEDLKCEYESTKLKIPNNISLWGL